MRIDSARLSDTSKATAGQCKIVSATIRIASGQMVGQTTLFTSNLQENNRLNFFYNRVLRAMKITN